MQLQGQRWKPRCVQWSKLSQPRGGSLKSERLLKKGLGNLNRRRQNRKFLLRHRFLQSLLQDRNHPRFRNQDPQNRQPILAVAVSNIKRFSFESNRLPNHWASEP